ncbi:MAG: cytochrome c peroxidase [Methylococcaceae bacterium]|nr:cytochrome c peroxidase [Methylococcaceae bacterium]
MNLLAFILCLLAWTSPLQAEPEQAVSSTPDAKPLAPGYSPLPFPAPKPGSYQLPKMGEAADGKVLDSDGKAMNLHDFYGDKLVLLGFIYATCDDVNGCPLATSVYQKIKAKVNPKPALADKLRLITMSFNPEHDTPQAMAHYGQAFRDAGVEWRFLTTASESEIQPILKAYGQSVEKEYDEKGQPTGKFSHLLRVFLIDRNKQIRNIYTVSVLHPDTVLADIETLLKETGNPPAQVIGQPLDEKNAELLRPGDDKSGYESTQYHTHSVALAQRQGKPAELLKIAQNPPLGLPKVPVPKDNPLSREKIELGRKLFFDRRLSLNNTMSCALCHIPEQGFTSQEQATSIGIEGRTVRRNAPTIYNVAFLEKLFHDGRESSLENQVWGPFLAHNEMANPSVGFVIDKLKGLPDYRGLFKKAFRRGPTMETVGQSLASYERTLLSANSPFDRWRYGSQENALSVQAKQGFGLFIGKAGCSQCHSISEHHALFIDGQLHNTGWGYRASLRKDPAKQKVQVAPGIVLELDAKTLNQVAEPKAKDLGRYEITQDPADRWKYRTPSLRNIALTAPYMHDGALSTLREVVEFYNRGGEANENLDPLIKPLGLSESEMQALMEFLNSLTGDDVETLVLDAYCAPLGDTQ